MESFGKELAIRLRRTDANSFPILSITFHNFPKLLCKTCVRRTPKNFRTKFWKVLENFGKIFGKVLESIGKYWKVLESNGKELAPGLPKRPISGGCHYFFPILSITFQYFPIRCMLGGM